MLALVFHGETDRQELHTVNPVTMEHALLARLPNVRSIGRTFTDETRQIAYFTGTDDQATGYRMYGVAMRSGVVLSSAAMPAFTYDAATHKYHGYNFGAFIHPMPDGTFVTVTWNGDAEREELHTVDPTTMTHAFVAAIPDVKWTGDSFTDTPRGMAYFMGKGDDDKWRLFGVDGKTGAVISSPAYPDFTYDNDAKRYRGFGFGAGFHRRADGSYVTIGWNGDANAEEIHTVNLATLEHSFLAVLGGATSTNGWFTDTQRGIAYVTSSNLLYGVDMNTGAVVSRPALPDFGFDSTTRRWHGYAFGSGYFLRAP